MFYHLFFVLYLSISAPLEREASIYRAQCSVHFHSYLVSAGAGDRV